VKYKQEKFQSELDRWDELVKAKAFIKERIEQVRIVDYLTDAKKIQESCIHSADDLTNQ